jgi:hypothetical protein
MPGWSDAESLCMKVISSVSAVASFTAVAMYLRFPHLRKKSYFTLQFYVAVSNVLTNIGSAIGVVETGTVACWAQGLLTNIFTLSSIQWTTVMAFSLFSIVHYEKQVEVTPLVHAYCWLPPILASVLPLINSTYGNVGNWCWIINTRRTPPWGETFWFWFSFYAWVWFGLIAMVYILADLKYFTANKPLLSKAKLDKVIHTLNLFPLVIFFSWAPVCCSDTMLILFDRYNGTFGYLTLLTACCQGALTAVIFWTRNEEIQRLLPLFFHPEAKIHTALSKNSNSSYSQSELNGSHLSTMHTAVGAAIQSSTSTSLATLPKHKLNALESQSEDRVREF